MNAPTITASVCALPAWQRWCCIGAVVLVTIGVYANSFDGVFVYDDINAIQRNQHIARLWPLSDAMSLPMIGQGFAVGGRPVTSLTLAVNRALLGPEPWGYHVGNVLIHVCAALLLLGVIRRTPSKGQTLWIALSAGILWAVHPLQTSSVAYLCQRAEALAGTFLLLTLYCTVRGATSQRPAGWYAAAAVGCLLGFGCKESILAAPLLVLLYDRTFLAGSFKQALGRRRWLYVGLLAAWVAAGAMLIWKQLRLQETDFGVSSLTYALTQPRVIVHYLRLVFWPDALMIDYGWKPVSGMTGVLLFGAVIIVLLAITVWGLVRRSWWGFAGAWFFLLLAPSSSVAALRQYVQEQRMYVALAAVMVLVVVGVTWVLRKLLGPAHPRAAAGAGAVLLVIAAVALGWRTHVRNADYHTAEGFWRKNVEDGGGFVARMSLGKALLDLGRYDEAIAAHWAAIAMAPNDPDTWHALAVVWIRAGRPVEAVGILEKVLARKPEDPNAPANLGLALWMLKPENESPAERSRRLKRAEALFITGVRRGTTNPAAWKILGTLKARAGDLKAAEKLLRTSMQLDPGDRDMADNLSRVLHLRAKGLFERGQTNAAIALWQEALDIYPDNAQVHNALGTIWKLRGDRARAIRHFRRACAIDPEYRQAQDNLSNLLLESGRSQGP